MEGMPDGLELGTCSQLLVGKYSVDFLGRAFPCFTNPGEGTKVRLKMTWPRMMTNSCSPR